MTKYYDIESTLDRYASSPDAIRFLMAKIERSSPDAFHWIDVESVRELYKNDPMNEDLN